MGSVLYFIPNAVSPRAITHSRFADWQYLLNSLRDFQTSWSRLTPNIIAIDSVAMIEKSLKNPIQIAPPGTVKLSQSQAQLTDGITLSRASLST